MRLNTKLSKLKVVKIYKGQREELRLRYWFRPVPIVHAL